MYRYLFKRLVLTALNNSFTPYHLLFHYEQDPLLSPIPEWIEMVVYEHKVFMTLVNILLSALRHSLAKFRCNCTPI